MTITKQERDIYAGLKLRERLNLHFDLIWASLIPENRDKVLLQLKEVDETVPDTEKATYRRVIQAFWDMGEEYIGLVLSFSDLVIGIFQIESAIKGLINKRAKDEKGECMKTFLIQYDALMKGVLEWREKLGKEREARLLGYFEDRELVEESIRGVEDRVRYAKLISSFDGYPKMLFMDWGFVLSVIKDQLFPVMFKDAREQALAQLYA